MRSSPPSRRHAFDTAAAWSAMHRAGRNLGTEGLVMQATPQWTSRCGTSRPGCWTSRCCACSELAGDRADYGSGGFTTLDSDELAPQVEDWEALGCTAMKIKIGEGWGHHVTRDLDRMRVTPVRRARPT